MSAAKCTCHAVRHAVGAEDRRQARLKEQAAIAAGRRDLADFFGQKLMPCSTAAVGEVPAASLPERVTAVPDASWFRVAVTVPADTLSGTDLLDQLAAAFAEDPDGIAERLLELHALNEQTAGDVDRGDDYAADHSGAQADAARAGLARDLPLDVTVRLKEHEARGLSESLLAAARKVFSARIWAGAVSPQHEAGSLGRAA